MGFFSYVHQMLTTYEVSYELWTAIIIGLFFFVTVYVLQTIGLYTVASREGYGHKWMAFVPFFNTYYIGVCGQKNKFFNLNTKKIAIVAAVLEFLLFCGFVLFLAAYLSLYEFLELEVESGESLMRLELFSRSVSPNIAAVTPELDWAVWCYKDLYIYIISWLSLVYDFILIVVLNCFFQTYSARHYFIFTLASIFFPVQGIMIFAVRNNKGMSYAEYMRRLQEQMYRQYRNQQTYYRDPYNNPYSGDYRQPPHNYDSSGQQEEQYRRPPEDPFSEFGNSNPSSSDSDPFSDFKN